MFGELGSLPLVRIVLKEGLVISRVWSCFSTLAISSLIMPAIVGVIADKWMNAERLYGLLHIFYGVILFFVPSVADPGVLYYYILAAMLCYMPTISLSNSVSFNILKTNNFDVVKVFPPIRVWGTIGFIVAMWVTNLTGSKANGISFTSLQLWPFF